ncbi:MAG: hypothetical protein GXO42_01650 [bacterium]|nr:hypothetical protein [bacterium]
MDLVHIILADTCCEIIVMADNTFAKLENIINFEKLKKIVVLIKIR